MRRRPSAPVPPRGPAVALAVLAAASVAAPERARAAAPGVTTSSGAAAASERTRAGFDLAARAARTGPAHEQLADAAPRQETGGYRAKVVEPTIARRSPTEGGTVARVDTRTQHTGNATRLLVLAARRDDEGRAWLRVALPVRPNRTTGWILAEKTLIDHTPWFVRVRLRARTVTTYRAGRVRSRVRAVIGKPATPTPRGWFAVYEIARQADPHAFIGRWAVHLTAFSDVLYDYGGGPGRVALHGRGPASRRADPLGTARSHGCVRITDGDVDAVRRHATPGTPVRITD